MNNKIEIIARRIFGWKLNRWDRWYDYESKTFVYDYEFQPNQNLDHARRIVKQLEKYGFTYKPKGENEVCFNNVCASGTTLAEAITNAAYEIAENNPIDDAWL